MPLITSLVDFRLRWGAYVTQDECLDDQRNVGDRGQEPRKYSPLSDGLSSNPYHATVTWLGRVDSAIGAGPPGTIPEDVRGRRNKRPGRAVQRDHHQRTDNARAVRHSLDRRLDRTRPKSGRRFPFRVERRSAG